MRKIILISIISNMIIFFGTVAFAGSKVYTDADISGYTPPEESTQDQYDRERKMQEENRQNSWDYDNWCNQGEYYRERIRDAERDIEKYEKELSEAQSEYKSQKFWKKDEYVSNSGVSNAEYNLKWATDRKEDAVNDLRDLENRAHAGGVPPGWVRCQK